MLSAHSNVALPAAMGIGAVNANNELRPRPRSPF